MDALQRANMTLDKLSKLDIYDLGMFIARAKTDEFKEIIKITGLKGYSKFKREQFIEAVLGLMCNVENDSLKLLKSKNDEAITVKAKEEKLQEQSKKLQEMYKQLAKFYHPDNQVSGDEEKFKELQGLFNDLKEVK